MDLPFICKGIVEVSEHLVLMEHFTTALLWSLKRRSQTHAILDSQQRGGWHYVPGTCQIAPPLRQFVLDTLVHGLWFFLPACFLIVLVKFMRPHWSICSLVE